MCKCKFPNGIIIKPDGINELDPCIYQTQQVIVGAIVVVSKCERCGNIDISWIRTEDTIEIPESDWDNFI